MLIYTSIDTETEIVEGVAVPFIATSCNEQLKTSLFDVNKKLHIERLKKICGDKKIHKVFFNAPYDIYCLSNIDIEVSPPYDDVMVASAILNENYISKRLKDLAKRDLQEPCYEDKELKLLVARYKKDCKKQGVEFSWKMIPPEILYPYAKMDAVYTIKLWYLYKKELLSKYRDVYNMEMSLVGPIVDMIKNGIQIDRRQCRKNIKEDTKLINKYYNLVMKDLKRRGVKEETLAELNVNSPKQLASIIQTLNIPVKETARGEISTAKDALLLFRETYKWIDALMKYKVLSKRLGTYYKPLLNHYTSKDRIRAHFIFYQSGAKTGRFSAELIQTIPHGYEDNTRAVFVPKPGYKLVSIDYKGVEMRLFAHFSKCKMLLRAFREGIDPHTATAVKLFGKEILLAGNEAIFDKRRKQAKSINFGIIYGMGRNKLAASLGISYQEACEILDNYYEAVPVKKYLDEVTSQLYRVGYIDIKFNSSLMKMYRRYRIPQQLAYKSVNAIVQGTAAYVLKFAMLRVTKLIADKHLDIKLLLQVHDELVFEMPESYGIKKVKMLQDAMADLETFSVPIVTDAKWSNKNWKEVKEVE